MAPPIYRPTSVAAGVKGLVHHRQAVYRSGSGVTLHPLQMTGDVPSDSHDLLGAMDALGPRGLGEPAYPAGYHDMRLPPVVPLAGSPRDPKFQV